MGKITIAAVQETMVENGLFYGAKVDSKFVATVYVRDPADEGAELGGAFVVQEWRGSGLFKLMGTMVVVAAAIAFDIPNSEMTIIGHVLEDNQKPRRGLELLGFSVTKRGVAYRPEDIPGLEHMKVNEQGEVIADLYQFDSSNLHGLVDTLLRHPWELQVGDKKFRVDQAFSALTPELLQAFQNDLVK